MAFDLGLNHLVNYVNLPSIILQGGKILTGGSVIESEGNYVQPTIVEISPKADVVKEELFAPVLYVMKFQVASWLSLFVWWVFKVKAIEIFLIVKVQIIVFQSLLF